MARGIAASSRLEVLCQKWVFDTFLSPEDLQMCMQIAPHAHLKPKVKEKEKKAGGKELVFEIMCASVVHIQHLTLE
jgi:hypothetical protein